MDYIWYPAYREAILETNPPRIRARLVIAERKLVDRLRVLSQDHGGTDEERKAMVDALNGIKNLRTEIAGWKRSSGTNVA
jgi:hypothetical protein